jgi:hypothetical protein
MLSFPRDPWRDNLLAPCSVPCPKIFERKVPFVLFPGRVAPRANAARGAISHGERKSTAALCRRLGRDHGVDHGEQHDRGRPAKHCGNRVRSVAEIYRDETSDFIAGCSASTTLFGEFETARMPVLSQLIRHLGEAGHGAFLVTFSARSAHPHGADRLVADLDGHTAA